MKDELKACIPLGTLTYESILTKNDVILSQLEKLQTMKDLMYVNEATGSINTTSGVDLRYVINND